MRKKNNIDFSTLLILGLMFLILLIMIINRMFFSNKTVEEEVVLFNDNVNSLDEDIENEEDIEDENIEIEYIEEDIVYEIPEEENQVYSISSIDRTNLPDHLFSCPGTRNNVLTYNNQPWFTYLEDGLNFRGFALENVADTCFSEYLNSLVFIVRSEVCGEYGKMYRFDINTKIMHRVDESVSNLELSYPLEFGRRNNDVITITSNCRKGDCNITTYYNYQFLDDVLKITKNCKRCGGLPLECIDY